jgi:RimJ/RimL family protein N-acetyltransferase
VTPLSTPATPIPSLDTPRLTLRGHRLADLADCVALWADPAVTLHIGGRPFTQEEVWSKVLRYVGHWSVMGFGYWVVCDRASGRFIGEVGFADFKRDITPSFGGAPEAGWALMPWAHGRGLATEAVQAALGWLEGRFGRVRTVCMIDPEYQPSIRVAEKCGYVEWLRTTYKSQPATLFARQLQVP